MVEHRPPRNWSTALPLVLVLGLLVLGALAGYAVSQVADKDETIGAKDAVIGSLCDDPKNANTPECDAPAASPGPTGARGETGPQGPPPSSAQVRAAVFDLLPLFVGPGIADFCGARACDGPRGADGAPGADGKAGERGLTGEQGPTGPQGPPGEAGAQGPPGEDGQDCPDDTSLQETTVMTSPTESTVIYACR